MTTLGAKLRHKRWQRRYYDKYPDRALKSLYGWLSVEEDPDKIKHCKSLIEHYEKKQNRLPIFNA